MKYLPYARNVLQVFIYIISFNLPQLTNKKMETVIMIKKCWSDAQDYLQFSVP